MKSTFGKAKFGSLFGDGGNAREFFICYINKTVNISCNIYKTETLTAEIL
jgi:hypothetical protein